MTAKKLSIFASVVGLCACVAAAETAFAIDMGTQGPGAAAQAQVGTQGTDANAQAGTPGAGANAQVGTPGTGANAQAGTTGTGVNVKAGAAAAPMTGMLTVKDADLRTFTITGQTQVYVAPETVDLKTLEGENVTVTFDPNGRVTNIQVDRQG